MVTNYLLCLLASVYITNSKKDSTILSYILSCKMPWEIHCSKPWVICPFSFHKLMGAEAYKTHECCLPSLVQTYWIKALIESFYTRLMLHLKKKSWIITGIVTEIICLIDIKVFEKHCRITRILQWWSNFHVFCWNPLPINLQPQQLNYGVW